MSYDGEHASSSTPRTGVVQVTSDDVGCGLVGEFASEVYERAFEDKHLEPASSWLSRLKDGSDDPEQYAFIRTDGRRVQGGMLLEVYPPGVVLLTYIVVRPELWDRGFGYDLMGVATEVAAGRPLFAEMADPARHQDDLHAVRRARVLHRWGWRTLVCQYLQPPLDRGGRWADDLLLLHHGPDEQVPSVHVEALNSGLRRSLQAGDEPAVSGHRWPAAAGDLIRTAPLTDLLGPSGRGPAAAGFDR